MTKAGTSPKTEQERNNLTHVTVRPSEPDELM